MKETMHQTRSRRRQIIQRTIVYTLMTTFVVGLVTVLVLLMLGYRFNRLTNTIEQGGLVQFVTHPSGASVTVGNAHLIDTTPSKITVNAGHYQVKMEKSGYRLWQKSVDVEAGEVLWLNYAQLVPEKITTTTVASFASLYEARVSPTGRYYALLPDAIKPSIVLIDMADSKYQQTNVNLNTVAGKTSGTWHYTIASWSNDSNFILVKRTQASQIEWLLVDRHDPAKSQNLTSTYKKAISTVLFDPNSSNRLILRMNDGTLQTADVSSGNPSDVLLRDITGINVSDDTLLYVQQKSPTIQSVGYMSLGGVKGRELVQRETKQKLLIDIGSYYGDLYTVIATGNEMDLYRLSALPNSASTTPITMTPVAHFQVATPPLNASIRSAGRLAVVESQRGFLTYDLELGKMTSTDLGTTTTSRLTWLDKYHVGYVVNGRFTIIEFDGGNRQEITEATAGFEGDQSSDNKYVYSFLRTDRGVELRRSQMILSN